MNSPARIVVLISGRGSNLKSIIAHQGAYEVAAIISDKADAAGLVVGKEEQIACFSFARENYSSKAAQKSAIYEKVREISPDFVALAGFMQIIEAAFVEEFFGKLVNIHPSLLPEFPGLHTHQRALDAGAKKHGCTVHYVDAGVDSGPIIAQASCCVLPEDNEHSLASRVLEIEHKLYPWALAQLAQGNIWIEGRTVRMKEGVREEMRGKFSL